MSQYSVSGRPEERKRELNVWRAFKKLVTLLPSVSLDMKVMPVLWRSKLFSSGWNAIVCQTKGMVSWHPLVCMHDQHFQKQSLDLNLRLHSAQKAAGFVSGEKLLGMSKLKTRHSHLQTRALIMLRSTTTPCYEDSTAELRLVVYKSITLKDWKIQDCLLLLHSVWRLSSESSQKF